MHDLWVPVTNEELSRETWYSTRTTQLQCTRRTPNNALQKELVHFRVPVLALKRCAPRASCLLANSGHPRDSRNASLVDARYSVMQKCARIRFDDSD